MSVLSSRIHFLSTSCVLLFSGVHSTHCWIWASVQTSFCYCWAFQVWWSNGCYIQAPSSTQMFPGPLAGVCLDGFLRSFSNRIARFLFRLLGLFSSDNLQLVCWAFTCNSLFYWAVTGHLMGFYCLLWLCIMLSVLLTAGRWSCDRLLWCQPKHRQPYPSSLGHLLGCVRTFMFSGSLPVCSWIKEGVLWETGNIWSWGGCLDTGDIIYSKSCVQLGLLAASQNLC